MAPSDLRPTSGPDLTSLERLPSGRVPPIGGPEQLDEQLVARLGGRAVVVVDPAVVGAAIGDGLAGAAVHVVAPGEPTSSSVAATVAAVRASDATVVVGVGGGSALDTAKLAAALAGASGSDAEPDRSDDAAGVEAFLLAGRPLPIGPPVVAVPTTAGTGSEVTRTVVVTDRRGRKVWAWGPSLLPALVVLDPALTVTVPAHVTTATGLDALVHAIEAATGRRAGAEPVELVVEPAVEAIALVATHLSRAVAEPGHLHARRAMQQAALLAGVAIDGGGTGIAHAIGHGLGTLAHVPHGVAVAAGLDAALAWELDGEAAAFEPVAAGLGCDVADVPAAVEGLLTSCGFDGAVARVGPLDVDAGQLAAAMAWPENRPMLDNACRAADAADRRRLAERVIERWRA